MKAESTVNPGAYSIEHCGGLAELAFYENIESNGDMYTYDEYRLTVPWRDNLETAVAANATALLELAKSREWKTVSGGRLKAVNAACQDAIYAGIDVETSYGKEHFSLSMHDQQNLSAIKMMLADGASAYPYHADGKSCAMYPAADLNALIEQATQHITYHTTYCNMLRIWINREIDMDVLRNIYYGSELPVDLKGRMEELL